MAPTAQEEPQYPEYSELLEEARRRSHGFVNPSDVRPGGRYDQVAWRRGEDWCVAVLGRGGFLGTARLTHTEAELLVVADERDVDPPLPPAVVAGRAAAEQRRQDAAARSQEIADRDQAAWQAALEAAPADLTLRVHTNVKARPRYGERHYLGHAVPTVDVYSGRDRVHRAGAALCETPARANALHLDDEPSDVPATCDRCLTWTPKVRTSR